MVQPASRPGFIEALSEAHYAGLARCVVLTGNVDDLFPVDLDGSLQFVSLERALHHALTHARYPKRGASERFLVVALKSDGLRFPHADDAAEIREVLPSFFGVTLPEQASTTGPSAVPHMATAGGPRATPLESLAALGDLLRASAEVRRRGGTVRPIAAIVDHADALFPTRDLGSLSADDRQGLTYFCDLLRDERLWADGETAEVRSDFLVLLSPTAAEINRKILTLPKTTHVEIPLPDVEARRAFVGAKSEAQPITFDYPGSTDPAEDLVQDARGLSIRALDDAITRAHRSGSPVGRAAVVSQVNATLQARLGSVIKIVYPDHGMADVVGFRKLKLRLIQLKRRIDNPARAPAGMTVVGPNGSGKTFICEAFAADTGRVAVTFSQIRSQWFGQTDAFAEMFESALSVFGRIVVLVDEAHAAFGSIHDRDTHETEARLTRHIIQMMDNESNRSNIFWALMTTRPDLLDPDIVRRGRCSLFVPIFDPEGEEAGDFIQWMLGRFARDGVHLSDADVALLRERSAGFSAGDYREFSTDFLDEREFRADLEVAHFLDSWTPSAVSLAEERQLQTLLAALRCDWRELLPERYRATSRAEIQAEADRLKLAISW